MLNTQQGEQTELARIRQLLELVMQENRELKRKIATLEGQKETQPMDTTSVNTSIPQSPKVNGDHVPGDEIPAQGKNHCHTENLNPPRKRAKETCEPKTQEDNLDGSGNSLKTEIRAEMNAAVGEAVTAMQEIIQRAVGNLSDRISQIEATMNSRMSQMEGAIAEKRSKHSKPYDRYSSNDRYRSTDPNDHTDADYK